MTRRLIAPLLAAGLGPVGALPPGFEMNTFAEPFEVEYPAALTAAPEGVVYVSCDQNGSLDKKPDRGRVVACHDSDGDGKADRFVDFIPNVDSPRGGHFVGGTLFLVHPPYLAAYRDTTGDGVADRKEVLVDGFGFGLDYHRGADHTSNGCRMGIDGWIYVAVGDFGMPDAKGADGRVVTLHGGGVARVRPDGSELEVYSSNTRNICDVAMSPYLDGFTRDNTNDGKGWNIRVHHFTNGSEHGYPRLYKNFAEEAVKPLLDLGGGSGTGALYLHEPGMPEGYGEALFTCDWTTGKIYRHPLKPFEATFTAEEEVFMKLGRAVDMDVDGESQIYVCDWRNGKYTYAGPKVKVGMVHRIVPRGAKVEPWPAMDKASAGDLRRHLRHRSAVRRLEAQREILRRGKDQETAKALFATAKDGETPLYARVAAIFTFKQLYGADATPWLAELTEDATVREFALRAMTDRRGELEQVPAALYRKALQDANPRVRLQAVIGLGRLQDRAAAPELLKLAASAWRKAASLPKGEQFLIPHHSVRVLAEMQAVEACLAAVADPHLRAVALRALQMMHEPAVVDGLVRHLEKAPTDNALRLEVMPALARLFHREGRWDRKAWWGTRPDDRGPYFLVETWDATPKIKEALERSFSMLPASDHAGMLEIFAKNRIDVSKLDLGKQDPVMMALGAPTPDAGQIRVLTDAALDPARPWKARVDCFRALQRGAGKEVLRNQVGVLAKWLHEKGRADDAEQEISEFINAPALVLEVKRLHGLATRENDQMSRIAWRAVLTFAHSPLIKERFRENAMRLARDNPRETGFFLALADLKLSGFEEQIAAAIESDNDELIAAAERARKITSSGAAATGKKVAELDAREVARAAMEGKGDVALGKKLFTRQGCVACHAVSLDAVQKGPYLGSAGSKFTRDYLVESILDPAAVVSQGFQTYLLTTRDGATHMGFITAEADGTVELRNIAGIVTKLRTADIVSRQQQDLSMMPAGLAGSLSVGEFVAMVEYLASLKEE
ncbi:MAG: c-type cytochrome [Akkermansiaceae bacterium]|nr:c-type cytochrome [Akkermansiaceae bacterium]